METTTSSCTTFQSGSTTLASVDSFGNQSNSYSDGAAISGDGRVVAFFSDASNLVSGDTNGINDVFLHDRQTGATTRASVGATGQEGNSDSDSPSVSFNGGFTAFDSDASNFVGGDNNGTYDIFVRDACQPPITYCSAKLNSLGCLPAIAAAGCQASATAGFGFVVTGSNVRNNKSGLLFYGVSGQSGLPFQGGTLCVKSPIKRTVAVSSGGTPAPANDCSGVFGIDMNTFAVGGLGGNPLAALTVPGTVVNCQWWGRDPGLVPPNNTTLTDGLEYTVGP